MTFDDKMRRASAEVRGVVAGRGREPIGQVKKRAGLQRVVAFGGGTLLVLLSVGAVAMAGGGGGAELLPVGNVTTTVAPTTTVVVSGVEEPTTTSTSTTVRKAGGDGLSDPSGVPDNWLEELGAGSQILLMEQGVGIAAEPAREAGFEGVWNLDLFPGPDSDGSFRFGSDYEPGKTAQLFMELVVRDGDPLVTAYGVAPAGLTSLTLVLGEGRDAARIEIDQIYQRPEIGRSVFVGSFAAALLVDSAPVQFNVWLVAPTGWEAPDLDPATFGFRSARIHDEYTGPLTTEMFLSPPELIVDIANVESFPTVFECEGGTRSGTPPNQGRAIPHGDIYSTPLAAFEAIMDGELSGSWFPQSGYTEVRDPEGHIAYAKPLIEGQLDQGVVVLVEVTEVEGGWTVTRWEASGC